MNLFRKANTSSFSNSLHCEAAGLALLRETLAGVDCPVAVPEVIAVSDTELVLPGIDCRPSTPELMAALGEGLAYLHHRPQRYYGLGYDNYIGLSPQRNRWTENWGTFFRDWRLGFQIERIQDAQIREEFQSVLHRRGDSLADFLNAHCERPSLLHGDLWCGNVLFNGQCAWLIDPAVYHGDREADLAMTEFFGGFSAEFYTAYQDALPLSAAYPAKRDIYNLYHALNHYNLFGKPYLERCRALLKAWP